MGRFTNPRDLYFGEGARHEVKNLKGKKAIIVSGGSSMRRGGFLQDVEADLKEAGMEVIARSPRACHCTRQGICSGRFHSSFLSAAA